MAPPRPRDGEDDGVGEARGMGLQFEMSKRNALLPDFRTTYVLTAEDEVPGVQAAEPPPIVI